MRKEEKKREGERERERESEAEREMQSNDRYQEALYNKSKRT